MIEDEGKVQPTFGFLNGTQEQLRFQLCDVHKPLVSAHRVVEAGHRILMQPEAYGPSYIEHLSTGGWHQIWPKEGVYQLPAWIKMNDEKNSDQKDIPMLAPVSQARGN